MARALGDAIAEPIILGNLSLDTEASIGIAVFPDDGDDVAQLLQRADVAMYTAKAQHLGHAFYGPENDDYSPERLALVGELRRALGENELVLLYQPKVDLSSGRISSVEVLIRWQHPGRGLLPPSEFVPLAELTTLIRPLTLHVLNRALLQLRDWNREGRDLTTAVNVSARNLLDPDFPDLARNLGLRVVAEGVEDQAAYETLRGLGCHLGQGFHMSRPVPAGELEVLLDDPSWAERTVAVGAPVEGGAPS